MNILVNGGSISRGPTSWPYHVQSNIGGNLINLAQAGSGNSYVHETTIAELSQRHYDIVLIQWTPFVRVDYKVKDIHKFNTIYTSKYQSEHNDWPGKVIHPVNDQDYVEKDWVFGCGYLNNSKEDAELTRAFEDYYHYTGAAEHMYHALMKIISLQSYLKVNNIPYLFCFGRPLKLLKRYDFLNQQLDYSRMYTDHYILDIASNNNWWVSGTQHPNDQAYKQFADLITPKIKSIL